MRASFLGTLLYTFTFSLFLALSSVACLSGPVQKSDKSDAAATSEMDSPKEKLPDTASFETNPQEEKLPDTTAPNPCGAGRQMCRNRCIDVLSDAANCGGCGRRCIQGKCQGGACVCDNPKLTACKVIPDATHVTCWDTSTSLYHCGKCGKTCKTDELCTKGACTPIKCNPGQTICGRKCVDIQSDTNNCGQCGYKCAGGNTVGSACQQGACQTTCKPSFTKCKTVRGETCVSLTSDTNNCGTCGNRCESSGCVSTGSCREGECRLECISGFRNCDGYCQPVDNDVKNCGACGNVCKAGEGCVEGTCKPR